MYNGIDELRDSRRRSVEVPNGVEVPVREGYVGGRLVTDVVCVFLVDKVRWYLVRLPGVLMVVTDSVTTRT